MDSETPLRNPVKRVSFSDETPATITSVSPPKEDAQVRSNGISATTTSHIVDNLLEESQTDKLYAEVVPDAGTRKSRDPCEDAGVASISNGIIDGENLTPETGAIIAPSIPVIAELVPGQLAETDLSPQNAVGTHAMSISTPQHELSLGMAWREDKHRAVEEIAGDEDPNGIQLENLSKIERAASDPILASIRGEATPQLIIDAVDGKRPPSLAHAPSECYDRGDRMYTHVRSGRATSPVSEHSDDQRRTLEQRLYAAINGAHPEKKGFLPRNQLAHIINEEAVVLEMNESLAEYLTRDEIKDYAKRICGGPETRRDQSNPSSRVPQQASYQKIFAILVLNYETDKIKRFVDEGISDGDLPLMKSSKGCSPGTYVLRKKGSPDRPLNCFEGWKIRDIIGFEEWQWSMLAPFFSKSARNNVQFYHFEEQIILPFTKDARREQRNRTELLELETHSGGYSDVFRVNIHADHHDFRSLKACNQGFAIKGLHSRDKEEFTREVEILKRFSGDSHNHLISLLATYSQFGHYYLIFHWAEADLLRYWKMFEAPTVDEGCVSWVAGQCAGIATGLHRIHEYKMSPDNEHLHPDNKRARAASSPSSLHPHSSGTATIRRPQRTGSWDHTFGRHGDIKPENILWFKDSSNLEDRGVLKISDFGLSDVAKRYSQLRKPKSGFPNTPTYRSPERDMQGGQITRSYDIWSLGCVYLEFMTWLLGGYQAVNAFSAKRRSPDIYQINSDTFFEIVTTDSIPTAVMIKREVEDWIAQLHEDPSCTEFIHDFLNLIKLDMLVVETQDDVAGEVATSEFDPNSRKRMSCMEVQVRLHKMAQRCITDGNYAATPAPWQKAQHKAANMEAVEVALNEDALAAPMVKSGKLRKHKGDVRRSHSRARKDVEGRVNGVNT